MLEQSGSDPEAAVSWPMGGVFQRSESSLRPAVLPGDRMPIKVCSAEVTGETSDGPVTRSKAGSVLGMPPGIGGVDA